MTSTRSPYEVLGIEEGASPEEIRKAYRRQAARTHPDRNPGDPDAAEAFLAVREAFEALDAPDPGAGFDAERVAAEMQRAAEEVERRRSRGGAGGRAWQQARVVLDRSVADRVLASLMTTRALAGVGIGAALGLGLAFGLGGMPGAALGGSLGLAAFAGAAFTAPRDPWAVETHWQGLRDLRWNVVLGWAEIVGVQEGDGVLDLALTDGAAARLRPLVPASAFGGPALYRLPLRDASRLASLVRAQLTA